MCVLALCSWRLASASLQGVQHPSLQLLQQAGSSYGHQGAGHYSYPELLNIQSALPPVTVRITNNWAVPVPVPHPVPVTRVVHVPVHIPVKVPVDRPYPVPVIKHVAVPVDKPYPVTVEKPVPVEVPKPYPVPVQQPVAVPVPKPYPVPVIKQIPVTVLQPYPVAIQKPILVQPHQQQPIYVHAAPAQGPGPWSLAESQPLQAKTIDVEPSQLLDSADPESSKGPTSYVSGHK